MSKSHVDAVCMIIESTGFTAMANQYRNEPDKRYAIINFISKQIAEVLGQKEAQKFIKLAKYKG